jgi:nucleoid-associated protein YgaU
MGRPPKDQRGGLHDETADFPVDGTVGPVLIAGTLRERFRRCTVQEKRGDTLTAIARSTTFTYQSIRDANGIEQQHQAGAEPHHPLRRQEATVKAEKKPSARHPITILPARNTYIVKKGDTLNP